MEYTVEKILAQKRFKQRNGREIIKYKVKWEGYEEVSWEPAGNLRNCRAKIDEFLASRDDDDGHGGDGETGGDASAIVPSNFMAMLHATATSTTSHDVEAEEKLDDTEQLSIGTVDPQLLDVYDLGFDEFNHSDDQVSDQEPEFLDQEPEPVQEPDRDRSSAIAATTTNTTNTSSFSPRVLGS